MDCPGIECRSSKRDTFVYLAAIKQYSADRAITGDHHVIIKEWGLYLLF
jgi:hypothetical protein